jgi:PBP4 family serine-type D-alanyl-D-alanine carboxypeptidase
LIRNRILLLIFVFVVATQAALSQADLARRIEQIIARPEYRHALIGIEFYSLDKQKVLYGLNSEKLFLPASTTKLMTEGTALNVIGPDYRFRTRIYRDGSILPDGTLDGNLVLVAAGDPNLSARVQPNDTLTFENWDHSLSGAPDTRAVPGDPLKVIRELSQQVAAHGIKRIKGQVLVDVSLFPEGQREPGTGTSISPIVINDNLVDITIAPGKVSGDQASLNISPSTDYVHFVNHVTTANPDSQVEISEDSDVQNEDGTRTVTISGRFPLGVTPILFAYPVPVPSRFAESVLVQELQQQGVQCETIASGEKMDYKQLAAKYVSANLLAEHVSPPFSEDVKITLKVSQNLHAAMTPFLMGALFGNRNEPSDQAGFDLERAFLEKAGLDLTGAIQSAGEGNPSYFSPEFVVQYLKYMTTNRYYQLFLRSLPVLNQDGTLFNILPGSPAAGHVFAKTGTTGTDDKLNRKLVITSKGLAGYETTAAGQHLVFAIYVNNLSIPRESESESTKRVGRMLAEIAAAAYDLP